MNKLELAIRIVQYAAKLSRERAQGIPERGITRRDGETIFQLEIRTRKNVLESGDVEEGNGELQPLFTVSLSRGKSNANQRLAR